MFETHVGAARKVDWLKIDMHLGIVVRVLLLLFESHEEMDARNDCMRERCVCAIKKYVSIFFC